MAHVFIVDEKTLSIHLKYQFAGTGAKDFKCEFLENDSCIQANIERMLCGMIADLSRVRDGDNIIFYLQQTNTHEGMFFGDFKAVGEAFLCKDNYLNEDLGKNLTFRIKITPNEIYSKGISERECLDSLEGISHPSQLCWSLIYRKLKGNRGCTMITDYEYNFIMDKIKRKNNNEKLISNKYDYDKDENRIVASDGLDKYQGKNDSLNIKQRLLYKYNRRNAYETHLQAYILQNIDLIEALKENADKIIWLGNEVSCGVGMQSIDIEFIQQKNDEINIIICELKDEQPTPYIKLQINKYVQWIKEYIVPIYNKRVIIFPKIVAPKPLEKTKNIINSIKDDVIYSDNKLEIKAIKYIAFEIENENIIFKEVKDE